MFESDLKQIKKEYLVYRGDNTETPDEIIETDSSLHPEIVRRLMDDSSVTRVDLMIHQVFTMCDYLDLSLRVEGALKSFSDTYFKKPAPQGEGEKE